MFKETQVFEQIMLTAINRTFVGMLATAYYLQAVQVAGRRVEHSSTATTPLLKTFMPLLFMIEQEFIMKIFINTEHDLKCAPGACGNGLREADVVLKITRRVEGYLHAVGYDLKLFQI